ncbi:MAG TPA: hypothetical protein DCM71_27415 [Runella sp.]|nr:hypothetical protein [Runella sp.]
MCAHGGKAQPQKPMLVATSHIQPLNPTIPISNARRIVDARNKIIHGYDTIEPVNIWAIIINYLPILKVEVQQLLNS